ncbi:MAG: hypothetical protein AUF67_09250 [Acidobacteria bacterium 13_1_20CM_58_21]|nr:MAG: hypothetical protein AUF67_09250 [Acidobacteria bacterium 13_1_20CM_58_21]
MRRGRRKRSIASFRPARRNGAEGMARKRLNDAKKWRFARIEACANIGHSQKSDPGNGKAGGGSPASGLLW